MIDPESVWGVWKIVMWLLGHLKRLIGRGALPQDSWVPHINQLFRDKVVLSGPYRHEPTVKIIGPFPLTTPQAAFAVKERKRLTADPTKSNDPHAILSSKPNWNDDPVHFEAWSLDFAAVRSLRDKTLNADPLPLVLSVNSLLICRKSREIILHRRALHSDTFPNALHTIGGGYWPPGVDAHEGDQFRLRNTAIRETREESGVTFSLDENPPMVLLQELQTGFIQLAYLGVNISSQEAENLAPSREGTPVHIRYDDLPQKLLSDQEDWVPTGKAAILAWLALGAPNGGWNVQFDGIKPVALFRHQIGATGR
jgi:hypothetical protein